jgi:hypothetical protein
MKENLKIDGFNKFDFRDSHDQYLRSERNLFGKPSKHLLEKTVQLGDNPALRLCHKFENSISPTIVSLDKKSFEMINTPFI